MQTFTVTIACACMIAGKQRWAFFEIRSEASERIFAEWKAEETARGMLGAGVHVESIREIVRR